MAVQRHIGLMSGTSTDGVDGVLAEFDDTDIRILASASLALPPALRAELLALNQPGADELARAAKASNALADCYAQVVSLLLQQSGLQGTDVGSIGAHGQTVRHAPEDGYTVQLNAPARLAEHTGIAVVADFRSRDIAAGGQGAPLVPAFHAARFGRVPGRIILNLGGIANLTILGESVRGFDTGPANMLMDAWVQRHLGQAYDHDGTWAAGGRCDEGLLARLMADPWFELAPPKSTGRDRFSLDWLQVGMAGYRVCEVEGMERPLPDGYPEAMPQGVPILAVDVQATLLQLTVRTIADAIARHAPGVREVLACGGGARNSVLMARLAQALPCPLGTTADHGVPVQDVEALAFAWLAHAHIQGHAACLPAVTGARHASIAGCLYPAGGDNGAIC